MIIRASWSSAGVVGLGEPGDPLRGGSEQDPVACLAGADRQPDGQVSLAGAGRAEEDHVLPCSAGDVTHGWDMTSAAAEVRREESRLSRPREGLGTSRPLVHSRAICGD
jgi:hypothetical protein